MSKKTLVNKEVFSDGDLPSYVTRETSRNIAKRYGSIRFWARLNGFEYEVVRSLFYGRTQGKRAGSKSHAVKQALIKNGLWVEGDKPAPSKKKKGLRNESI